MNSATQDTELAIEIHQFVQSRGSLQLATINREGQAYASYAPFALSDNGFYVLISEIALHAKNLQVHPQASVLLIEDEISAQELFARVRINYQVDAQLIVHDTPHWHAGIAALNTKHGKIINHLSQHSDFKLFELTPTEGRYIKGFGRAYAFKGQGLSGEERAHLRDGHTKR